MGYKKVLKIVWFRNLFFLKGEGEARDDVDMHAYEGCISAVQRKERLRYRKGRCCDGCREKKGWASSKIFPLSLGLIEHHMVFFTVSIQYSG